MGRAAADVDALYPEVKAVLSRAHAAIVAAESNGDDATAEQIATGVGRLADLVDAFWLRDRAAWEETA